MNTSHTVQPEQSGHAYSPSFSSSCATGSRERGVSASPERHTTRHWIARAANPRSTNDYLLTAAAAAASEPSSSKDDVAQEQSGEAKRRRQQSASGTGWVPAQRHPSQYDHRPHHGAEDCGVDREADEVRYTESHQSKSEHRRRRHKANNSHGQRGMHHSRDHGVLHEQRGRGRGRVELHEETDGADVADPFHRNGISARRTEKIARRASDTIGSAKSYYSVLPRKQYRHEMEVESAPSTQLPTRELAPNVETSALELTPSVMLMTVLHYIAYIQRVPCLPLHPVHDEAVIIAFDKYLAKGATMLKFKAHGGAPHKRMFCIRFLDDNDVEPHEGLPNRHHLSLSRPMFCWYRHPHSLHVQGMRPLSDLIDIRGDEESHPFVQARRARSGKLKGARSGLLAHNYLDDQFILKFLFRVGDGVIMREDDHDRLAIVAQAPNECVYLAWKVLGTYIENMQRA